MRYNSIIHKAVIIILFIALFSIACTEIIEEDLTVTTVKVNMPFNNYTASNSNIQFWWNKIDGATHYNIQVVKPKFDSIIALLVDSNISGDKFNWSFQPGKYQWRIKACNESSCSPYQQLNFEIDSSLDLSNTVMVLINPYSNIYTNASQIQFEWLAEYSADYYYIKILDSIDIPIINDFKIYTNQISIPGQYITNTLPEGLIKWGIKSENSISTSSFTYSKFTIDRTKPLKPSLIKPFNNTIQQSDTIMFQWVSGTDKYPNYDSLYVFLDTTTVNLIRSYKTANNIIVDTFSTGSYFWYIKSYDKAGNKSLISDIRKISIQ